MADNIQATPRNYFGGLLSDAYKWMQSPERTQQMQGFAGLLGTTGVPQTIERMAYGEPLTNIGRANVPLLKPETADALMTVAPMVGPAARGAGRLAGEAINEAMVYGRGPLAGITPQPMRMDVWHGSPYIFNKFDAAKMGTGEGAQMYGQGTYLAQQQEVAKRFTPRDTNFEDALMKKYNQAEKSGDYASMQVYEDFLTQKTPEEIATNMADMGFSGKDLDSANKAFELAKKLYQGQTKGALYKVNLPDESIAKMIDWDAPIKDQPSNIQSLAEKYGVDLTDLGGDLAFKIGKTAEGQKIMQQHGITGVKYFDQMSRGDQNNARNFVVFDPNELNILERNSMPVQGLLGR